MQLSPGFRVRRPERFVLLSFALHVDLFGPVRALLRGGQPGRVRRRGPRGGRHVSLAVALGLLPDGIAACTVLRGPCQHHASIDLQVPHGQGRFCSRARLHPRAWERYAAVDVALTFRLGKTETLQSDNQYSLTLNSIDHKYLCIHPVLLI